MAAPLEEGEWSAARPGRTLPPIKTRYPFYTRLVGPQGRSRRAENLVTTGIRSRTIQPVVSRYTDWTTVPTNKWPVFVQSHHSHDVACILKREMCVTYTSLRNGALHYLQLYLKSISTFVWLKGIQVSEWVSKWVSEWVSNWMTEWMNEYSWRQAWQCIVYDY